MDPLSDVLRVFRLSGAFFYGLEASGSWRVETLAARQLTPRIMPEAEHLVSCHIVTGGRCCGGLVDEAPVELAARDVILFPHGDGHIMASGPHAERTGDVLTSAPARYSETVVLGERGASGASLICGFLGCDLRPFNPLLASLPRRMHLRGLPSAFLEAFSRQVTEESRLRRAGADTVLTRLAELMFIEVMRRYLEDLPPTGTGWLAGLRDRAVGQTLALLHAKPSHPWTLAELARRVASSRSRLGERFTQLVGQPPMQYLTQWRMQVAATLLLQSGAKVAAIGSEVGYDSEAAFSRAFKKSTGFAPGTWRESRRSTGKILDGNS